MKKWLNNISKRTWVRGILVTILFSIVTFSFVGEKIPVLNGIGWDGHNYYVSMQNFMYIITHHGYNQYDIMRAMPWGLVDIICKAINVAITPDMAIIFAVMFNAIALLLSVFFFFRISKLKHWKVETEALGFAFLFYSYPVLKFMGYYPVLSDVFGLTIGIMISYYFLADNKWALIACGFIGAFVWPTTAIIAFALAFFPRKPLPILQVSDKIADKKVLNLLFIAAACFPLLVVTVRVIMYHGHVMESMNIFPLTAPASKFVVPLTCVCTGLYLYYIVSAFNISLSKTLTENFVGKQNWKNYMWFIVCFIVSSGVSRLLANSEPGALTTSETILVIVCTSLTDPFVFIESHFFFFGLGFLLMLLLWREVANVIMKQGFGYLFVIGIWTLFSIRPEARVSMMYIVFPTIALLMYLDTQNIRPYMACYAVVFSLIFSRFWFPFNVPGMEEAMDIKKISHFIDFPAQRYFMSSGHWQSHDMYALFMAFTIIVGICLYVGMKRKWFTYDKIENE